MPVQPAQVCPGGQNHPTSDGLTAGASRLPFFPTVVAVLCVIGILSNLTMARCSSEPLDHARAAKVMGDLLVLGKMTGNCERAFLKPGKQKAIVEAANFSYEKWQSYIVTEPGRRLLTNFYKQCLAEVSSTTP